MSTWALVVMVLLVLLAAGIVVVAMRRGRAAAGDAPAGHGGPVGRTVGDLVRDRADTPPGGVPAEALSADAPAAVEPRAEPEPPAERRVAAEEVDAGPVGPPWTRGFVDGVPVEGPPRPRPQRRSPVDPALVARVTSVAPPAREERPVAKGIVSPAVAEAVARAEASRRESAVAEDTVPAPRESAARPELAVVHGGADAGAPRRGLRAAAAGATVLAFAAGRRGDEPARADTREGEPVEAEVRWVAPEDLAAREQARADEPGSGVDESGVEPESAVEVPPAASLPPAAPQVGPLIATPATGPTEAPATLSAVSTPYPTPVDPAERAAEHAAVDLALLRTLGFADPNPRRGAAPVVDLHVEQPEPVAEAEPRPVPVRFRVARRDHLPVAAAVVTLLDPRGRETASALSDADGRGSVTAPRPGGYVLVSAAEGHQPGVVAVTVAEHGTEVDVQLVRSSTVGGRVRDAAGRGVAGAGITLLQDGELVASTTSGPDGAFRVTELAAGEYTIAVLAGEHAPRVVTVRVAEEADGEQDVALGPVPAPHA